MAGFWMEHRMITSGITLTPYPLTSINQEDNIKSKV